MRLGNKKFLEDMDKDFAASLGAGGAEVRAEAAEFNLNFRISKKSFGFVFPFGLFFIFSFSFFCSAQGELVKVMAYNIDNYNLESRVIDGVYYKEYPKPEREKAALTQVIKDEHPDILALEEMGTDEYLAELLARLRAVGLDYPYTAQVQAIDEKRHVTIISRLPFTPTRYAEIFFNYEGHRSSVLRGLLEARFDIGGKSWRIFVVHLKSRISHDDTDPLSAGYRTAEAQAVRDVIVKYLGDKENFMVVGDFNDSPRSAALKRFEKKGPREIADMLPLFDSRREEWTHHWALDASFSRIDYILLSPPMLPAVVPGSAKIADGPGTLDEASDHRPVEVILDTEKMKGAR